PGDASNLCAIALDAGRAGQDHVEVGRRRALAEELLARLDLLDVGLGRQPAQLTLGATGEQRDAGELVGPGLAMHRANVRRALLPPSRVTSHAATRPPWRHDQRGRRSIVPSAQEPPLTDPLTRRAIPGTDIARHRRI